MRNEILELLKKDSRLTAGELAVLTGAEEQKVAEEIKRLTDEQVICGYNTLINWEKAGRENVSALIEVKVTPMRGQGFDKIAERIYGFDEVSAVYLMSGGFDLTVIVECASLKDVAFFISDKLSPLESVVGTSTHFVLKRYKDYGVIMNKKNMNDERMLVSP